MVKEKTPDIEAKTSLFSPRLGIIMGACQSAPSAVGTDHNFDAKKDVHGERCPTLLELECMIERRRRAGKRVHVNAVNVEFRRGLFEVYTRRGEEEDLSPAGFTAVHPEDERRAFVGTHMVCDRASIFFNAFATYFTFSLNYLLLLLLLLQSLLI